MRQVTTMLAMALFVLGCSVMPPFERVPLLTSELGCYAGGEGGTTGPLLADPTYGTSFMNRPVMWPAGYNARRAGSEVEVLDAAGNIKARTGRIYRISYAYAQVLVPDDQGSLNGFEPANAFPAAVDCGYHWDFIDCTANPSDLYCRRE